MKIIGIEKRTGLGMNGCTFRLPWQTRSMYYQLPATVEIDSYWKEIKFTNGVCRQAPQKGWCISFDIEGHARKHYCEIRWDERYLNVVKIVDRALGIVRYYRSVNAI